MGMCSEYVDLLWLIEMNVEIYQVISSNSILCTICACVCISSIIAPTVISIFVFLNVYF